MNTRPIALLVEDCPDMAEELGELLTELGHTFLHVRSRQEAQDLLEQRQFCYVLTDLQILDRPGSIVPREEAGFAVVEAARAVYPFRTATGGHTVPVILVTGYPIDRELVCEAKACGADAVLRKLLSENRPRLEVVIADLLRRGGKACHPACGATSREAA